MLHKQKVKLAGMLVKAANPPIAGGGGHSMLDDVSHWWENLGKTSPNAQNAIIGAGIGTGAGALGSAMGIGDGLGKNMLIGGILGGGAGYVWDPAKRYLQMDDKKPNKEIPVQSSDDVPNISTIEDDVVGKMDTTLPGSIDKPNAEGSINIAPALGATTSVAGGGLGKIIGTQLAYNKVLNNHGNPTAPRLNMSDGEGVGLTRRPRNFPKLPGFAYTKLDNFRSSMANYAAMQEEAATAARRGGRKGMIFGGLPGLGLTIAGLLNNKPNGGRGE